MRNASTFPPPSSSLLSACCAVARRPSPSLLFLFLFLISFLLCKFLHAASSLCLTSLLPHSFLSSLPYLIPFLPSSPPLILPCNPWKSLRAPGHPLHAGSFLRLLRMFFFPHFHTHFLSSFPHVCISFSRYLKEFSLGMTKLALL